MEEKINILNEDIEHLIIENEETKKIIAKITQYDIESVRPYQVRIKEKTVQKNNLSYEVNILTDKTGTITNMSLEELTAYLKNTNVKQLKVIL